MAKDAAATLEEMRQKILKKLRDKREHIDRQITELEQQKRAS